MLEVIDLAEPLARGDGIPGLEGNDRLELVLELLKVGSRGEFGSAGRVMDHGPVGVSSPSPSPTRTQPGDIMLLPGNCWD